MFFSIVSDVSNLYLNGFNIDPMCKMVFQGTVAVNYFLELCTGR